MTELQLKLTLDEVNQILDALGEQPFKQVYGLIAKLQRQAEDQLNHTGIRQPSASADQSAHKE